MENVVMSFVVVVIGTSSTGETITRVRPHWEVPAEELDKLVAAEVAAYLNDDSHGGGVPQSVLVRMIHD